ncbi:MATE family efflux transporter [Faunimonas pinastri]|uniref:MATE family efflux transporter n=1 Tax=Faunimonas pinastri TaxID=1855383 RepID=UPI0015A51653|nr:MATE family efflux transporter [Faunimonas pinastri]
MIAIDKSVAKGFRAETRAILGLAFPLALSNIAPFGFLVVNLGFLGRQSATALASGALAYGLFTLSLSLLAGLDSAAMAMIATARGERFRIFSAVRGTMHQAVLCSLVSCALIWSVLWWCEPILIRFGQEPHIAAGAGETTRTLMWALLPYTLFKMMRAFLGAHGRQRWPLFVVVGGVLLNGCLGYVLIDGPAHLGLRGAGLATLSASTVMAGALALVLVLDPRMRRYAMFRRWSAPDRRSIGDLLGLSIPISMTMLLENGVFYAAMISAGLFGEAQLAAHSITMQMVSLAFKVPVGLGQAATIRVAHARGAMNFAAAERAGRTTFVLTICFALIVASLMLLAPTWLIGFFIDTSDPASAAVVSYGRHFLFFAGIFEVSDAVQGGMAGVLRGYRDAKIPMLLAALGYWVLGLPTGLVLAGPFGLQGLGIWAGLAVGLTAVALMMVLRWKHLTALFRVPALAARASVPAG